MEKKQLNEESFAPKFGNWWGHMKKYVLSEEFYNTFSKIKQDAKKDKIYPESKNTFRCFSECDPSNLKVIMFGSDPYVGEYYDTKLPQATGLLLDNENTKNGKLQPSLEYFWRGVAESYEEEPEGYLTESIKFLSLQGVMLCNRALVVKKGKIGSCQDYFDNFWKYFIQEVITPFFPSIIFVFLGKEASYLKRFVFEMSNPCYVLDHPSYAARQNQTWQVNNTFKEINRRIIGNNGELFKIHWSYKEFQRFLEENEAPF